MIFYHLCPKEPTTGFQLFSTRPLNKILKDSANDSRQREEEINALFFDPNFTGKEVFSCFWQSTLSIAFPPLMFGFNYFLGLRPGFVLPFDLRLHAGRQPGRIHCQLPLTGSKRKDS